MTLTRAIQSNDPVSWLQFRSDRTNLIKELDQAKSKYLSDSFSKNSSKGPFINLVIQFWVLGDPPLPPCDQK